MTPSNYDFILLDIEGTTTPISFVHEVLFPYVVNTASEFLTSRWDDPQVQTHIRAIATQANHDHQEGVADAISIDLDSDGQSQIIDKVLVNIEWQMKADRKIGALKGLQGYMWRFGYESGQLQGVIYDDVVEALSRWTTQEEPKKKVYIYSSGSVEAQKLIFGYSDHGNLLGYISGHYDTQIGAKIDKESYARIAMDILGSGEIDPSRILFISDSISEIRAANAAGLQTIVSIRPGNAPLSGDDIGQFQTSTNFAKV